MHSSLTSIQVYIVEMEGKVEECAKKNVHNRSLEDIKEIEKNWERTPSHFVKLDVRNLLQDEASHHVSFIFSSCIIV